MTTSGGLSVGTGLGALGLGAPQTLKNFSLPPLSKVQRPYIAHLYDHSLVFKRSLGAGILLGKPALKQTQNGGFQPIALELANALPSVNLLPDPSFEADNTLADVQVNWSLTTPGEAALMTSGTDVRRGNRALKITTTRLVGNPWNFIASARLPVVPGQTYTISVWLKEAAGAKQSHCKVNFWNAAGGVSNSLFAMAGQDGPFGWSFFTASGIAPPDAVTADVECVAGYWDGVTGTNAQIWFDDARFVAGNDQAEGIELGDVIRLAELGADVAPLIAEDFEATDPADTSTSPGWAHNNVGSGTSNLFNNNSHSGSNAIQFTNPSIGNYGGMFYRQGLRMPSGGGTLRASIWLKGSGAGVVGPYRITFANPGAFIDSRGQARAQPSAQAGVVVVDFNPSITTGYLQYSEAIPIPVGYAFAFIEIYNNGGGGGVATLYVDDVNVWAESAITNGWVFGGTVLTTPEEQGVGATSHLVEVRPFVAELGEGYVNQTYSQPTDLAQWVRDAVATTAHCSVSPTSCPNTGILDTYDFQSTTPLDVIHVAKQRAGSNYWYGVDEQGLVYFQPVYPNNPATLTLHKGVDFNRKKPVSSIVGMKNKIPLIGGQNPGDTGRLKSQYPPIGTEPTASQLRYGVKSFYPTLSYPNITSQATLDAIAASLGSQYDRVMQTVEVDCPALGMRLSPFRVGGLTVRLWEALQEPLVESGEPGPGSAGPTLILQDVERDGPFQRLFIGNIPYTDIDPAYEALRVAQRTAVIAASAVATPALAPVAPPASTVILGRINASTGIFAAGGGIVTIATATFTTALAGVCQIIGSIDARMEAWNNYVGVPRRAVRATLSGGIFTGAWQELPFGLTRATYDLSSGSGLAIPAGTYTITIDIDTQATNQIHVYSGYAQVVWTG